MTHLRLIEPHGEGHHIALYGFNIAREALRRGWRVSIATTDECAHHASLVRLRAQLPSVEVLTVLPHVSFPGDAPTYSNLLRYQFRQARAFGAAITNGAPRPDLIYLVNLDYCDKAIALSGSPFGEIPFAGMLMSVRFHHLQMGVAGPAQRGRTVYKALFRRLLRTPQLRNVFTIDETLAQYAGTRREAAFRKISYVPDFLLDMPRIEREVARAEFGVPPDCLAILVYGALSLRKGIETLLGSVADNRAFPRTVVILAGAPDAEVEKFLAGPLPTRLRAEGRLIEHLRFLTERDTALAFGASDIVWLGYQNFFGMSGVLVQAASAGKPVIATQEGLVGWVTKRHGLGQVIDAEDPAAVRDALECLLREASETTRITERGRSVGARHRAELGAKIICDALRNSLCQT